jgi:hypothetical protein
MIAEICMPLQIGLNCRGYFFPLLTQQRQAFSRYQVIGFPLSAICSRSPMEMDKPLYFFTFKRRGPFKFKKKYPAPNSTLISIDWYYF